MQSPNRKNPWRSWKSMSSSGSIQWHATCPLKRGRTCIEAAACSLLKLSQNKAALNKKRMRREAQAMRVGKLATRTPALPFRLASPRYRSDARNPSAPT